MLKLLEDGATEVALQSPHERPSSLRATLPTTTPAQNLELEYS